MFKIFIDPGHGGNDNGASRNGLKEKNVTLKIAKKINSLLKDYKDVSTKMSRKTNKTLSLKERTDMSNRWGANLFLSIHINAGGGTGFESYVYNKLSNQSNTVKHRKILHDEIMKQINVKDRGKKKANFHVLRESRANAILTENLFIDTKNDSNKLKQKSFINKIAHGHVNGIVKVYNLKKKKNNKQKNNTFYRVVTGSFKSKKNANDRVKQLKKKGFDSFIDVYKK